MRTVTKLDEEPAALARRAMLLSLALAVAGSGLGVFAILERDVKGPEVAIVLSSWVFGLVAFGALYFHRVSVKTLAALSTIYYALYLCSGIMAALLGNGKHINLFTYLVWFFPLLVFNKLVNSGPISQILGRFLFLAPLALLGILSSRVVAVFPIESLIFVVAFILSYICFALGLNAATRYREAYIVGRERAESLRIESAVLESVSDCFISVDSNNKLVYINEAASAELGIDRHSAINRTVCRGISCFFSDLVLAGLRAATTLGSAYEFEAEIEDRKQWYRIRCFPRPECMSVYIRNISESVLARTSLEAANNILRQQSNLLDKAQDAIFLQDMDSRLLYWNKGAERLFGWTSTEVMGMRVGDIFPQDIVGVKQAFTSTINLGEWAGELSKRHKNGNLLIVESRCTLLRNDDGTQRAILAINTDVTDRKAGEERVHQLAFYDVLTGLPNRVKLRDRLGEALAAVSPEKKVGALLHIDLDDFKTLNDTSGHDTGDRFLHSVAQGLTTAVRPDDIVARASADEFIILLEGLGNTLDAAEDAVRLIADRILDVCRQPFALGTSDYYGSACIGIILFQDSLDSADELLKRVDLAMARAKEQGRNSISFFDPSMETRVAARAALQSDLKRALLHQEFKLYYQPQLDRIGDVTGGEALLRWPHPTRGMIPPNEFIPLAEEANIIIDLGYWVLHAACTQLAEWHRRPDMERLNMAVNVSVRQFLDPNFVRLVEKVLHETGANPNRLKLEITESIVMEKTVDIIAKMTQLKAHGIGFSMDDFGTGYSSLSQLKRLPLNQLKIDQSFVRDVLNDVVDASFVRTIIALSRTLNLSVIAEGVETQGQLDFLEREGCYAYQGYLYSPALPAAGFVVFVEDSILRNRQGAA